MAGRFKVEKPLLKRGAAAAGSSKERQLIVKKTEAAIELEEEEGKGPLEEEEGEWNETNGDKKQKQPEIRQKRSWIQSE